MLVDTLYNDLAEWHRIRTGCNVSRYYISTWIYIISYTKGSFKMSRDIRKRYVKIAKDLYYNFEVIKKIKAAKSESEIMRILHQARLSTNY